MRLALLLFPLALSAQSPPPLASTFFGAGAGYSAPRMTSSMCLGLLVSQPAGLYSYSCYNSSYLHGKPTVSTETGAMVALRCAKARGSTFCLMGSGQGGLSAGTGLQAAFSLGGALIWHAKSGFTIVIPMTWESAGTGQQYRVLAGWSW